MIVTTIPKLLFPNAACFFNIAITSPYGQGRPGRVARKRAATKAAGGGDAAGGDESD